MSGQRDDTTHMLTAIVMTPVEVVGCAADELLMISRAHSATQWLIPRWVSHLIVQYRRNECDSDGAILRVSTDRLTATGRIDLFDPFFAPRRSDADRAALWAHELLHLHVDRLDLWMRGLIRRRLDGAVKEEALHELDDRQEIVVATLEHALRPLLTERIEDRS